LVSKSIENRKEIRKRQEKVSLKLDQRTNDISFFIREAARVRLLLKACWNGESYHMLPLYKKIAEIAGCSVKDLYMFYNWRDINVLLHNDINLSTSMLERRKIRYLLHFHDSKISLYSGDTALTKYNELLASSLPDKNITSFSGRIASRGSKGVISGRARIVKLDNPLGFQKIAETIEENDILVTGMTNPAMVVLMEKVKGIITDEGGIASHAAIISREFGIPCIVGTKIATSVLKEGENIELDANKGVIRRLNKSS
jgi:phosphohistidine swiveling domain-containing protein